MSQEIDRVDVQAELAGERVTIRERWWEDGAGVWVQYGDDPPLLTHHSHVPFIQFHADAFTLAWPAIGDNPHDR